MKMNIVHAEAPPATEAEAYEKYKASFTCSCGGKHNNICENECKYHHNYDCTGTFWECGLYGKELFGEKWGNFKLSYLSLAEEAQNVRNFFCTERGDYMKADEDRNGRYSYMFSQNIIGEDGWLLAHAIAGTFPNEININGTNVKFASNWYVMQGYSWKDKGFAYEGKNRSWNIITDGKEYYINYNFIHQAYIDTKNGEQFQQIKADLQEKISK